MRIVIQSTVAALCLIAVSASPIAAREPFVIPNPLPASYADIEDVVYGSIPAYLEQAQCGGYANTSVEGRIATVTGVPGRKGQWDGTLASGMAERQEEFHYPDEATGLSIAHYTDSPTCAELLNTSGPPSCKTPGECGDICAWANAVQYDVSLTVHRCKHQECKEVCEEVCYETSNPDDPEGPPVTVCEDQCETVCADIVYDATDVQYFEQRGALDQFNCSQCIAGDEETPADDWAEFAGRKYVCTGDADEEQSGELTVPYGWVWGDQDGSAILPTLPQCKEFWVDEQTEYPNCTTCGQEDAIELPGETTADQKDEFTPGAECRCGRDDDGNITEGCRVTERMAPLNDTFYWSFYRTYPGRYERAQAVGEGTEVLENDGDAFCFGPYVEFDPAERQTTADDRRCVIDINVSQLRDQQIGHGTYGEADAFTGPDPNDPFSQRLHGPAPGGPFEQLRDVWFLSFGKAFSLLSQPVFDGNLASALLTIDGATHIAADQTADGGWAQHSFVRAFDDTGEYRSVSRWWQQQETLAQRAIARPSTLRILLPSPQALGLSPDDPLFAGAVQQGAPADRRAAAISIQVDSNGAILDEAVSALERMFRIQVEPLRVPIVVPMGSPTEYRVLAESWCLKWMEQSGELNCDGATPDVQAIRERLDEYAQRIEDVRELRAELPFAVGKALELQTDVYAPIIEWMQENITAYQQYLAQREAVFALLPQWEENAQNMRRFAEEINMPWCMNRRFTTPIYSLLDPWLPARADGGSLTMNSREGSLPSLPELARQDAVIDISGLRLDGGGALSIPVFDVTQIKLSLLSYQPPETIDGNVPSPPPSLPSLDPALAAMRAAAQSVASPPVLVADPPPAITLPPLPSDDDIVEIASALEAIGTTIDDMSDTYNDFWRSIGPLKPDWSDFDEIAQDKLDHRCTEYGEGACQHVEMDLDERYTTIGSRIGILQTEDMDSTGLRRTSPAVCPYDDHTCDLLPSTRYPPRTGWQAVGTVDNAIGSSVADTVRAGVRLPTLPETLGGLSEDQVPPFAVQAEDLIRALFIPRVIRLEPEESSTLSTP